MNVYLDTSALVALTVAQHPYHDLVRERVDVPEGSDSFVFGLHALAEYYSTITKPRLPYALDPELARRQVGLLAKAPSVEVFEPTLPVYDRAIELAATHSLLSGYLRRPSPRLRRGVILRSTRDAERERLPAYGREHDRRGDRVAVAGPPHINRFTTSSRGPSARKPGRKTPGSKSARTHLPM